ncbi:MAG: ABC-F type ribosomal protection protein [Candidatus Faecousia sp.]|nr:ABC-F type ribosomal protection protein [Candidatus Faecousia sp.]
MSLIQVSNLTFAYDGSYETIFDHVSFQIDTDWKLGFTGRNGRGKTTFLNLLQGKYDYQGSISASVEFSYFPYTVADKSRLAVDVVEEIHPEYRYWRLVREMNALNLPQELLYRPYETLSGGEQTKLQLAVLFSRENNFLLIDEPTNHLDLPGRELVSRYLNGKRGFLLVSHDRAFLDGCVDHILSINKANIEVQRGNFSSWFENKRRQDAFEQAENEKLKKEIGRLQETAGEKARWSDTAERRKIGVDPLKVDNRKGYRPLQGAKAKKAMARAKAIETRQQAAIEEKSRLLKNIERADELKLFQTPFHLRQLIRLKDVAVQYDGREIFSGVSFTLEQGDRVALQGPNGCGKSTLIRLLWGEPVPHTGEVHLGNGLKISLVSQDSSGLKGSLSDLAREAEIDESLFLAILSKLDVPRAQLERDLSSLSAGQKKKVLLARSICQKAHLHIWDEPLNYIDVLSRVQIEELLLSFRPTILFVEHDKTFCRHIATKTVFLGGEL